MGEERANGASHDTVRWVRGHRSVCAERVGKRHGASGKRQGARGKGKDKRGARVTRAG